MHESIRKILCVQAVRRKSSYLPQLLQVAVGCNLHRGSSIDQDITHLESRAKANCGEQQGTNINHLERHHGDDDGTTPS